jgi:hypothetical protein
MLVATFNATTGWAGRQITWQDERIVLDGHGVITAADLMEYDRQGHLDWPSEEMRSWAAARQSWEQALATPAAGTLAAAGTVTTAEQIASEPAIAQPTTPITPITPTDAEPEAAEGVTDGAEPTAAAEPADEVRDVLAPGGDILEVIGTAPYQEVLAAIAGDKPETAPELEKWAHLVPEPDNPWDRNAVAVYVDSRKVGYLPRESSAAYAALLGQLWTTRRGRAVCRAVVGGGSYKLTTPSGTVSEVDEEQFGVRLALAAPQHFDVTQDLQTLSTEELAAGPPPV